MEERRNQQNRQQQQSQSGLRQPQQSQSGSPQQQGGQSGARQQQQSDTGRAAQAGGISGESNLAGQQQQNQGGISGLGDSDRARGMGQQGGPSSGGQQGAASASGQQIGAGMGQEHQFDMQGGQQSGGSGTPSRFADQIREHMEVVDDRGQHCGTVDHLEGDRIKLSRSDSKDGQHHYVPLSQVAGIEGNKVRLRERGDNDFGMEAGG